MNYPRFLLLPLALASLLLSSCGGVDWNLYYCVQELPSTCTGVDLTKPVGGVAYVPRGQEREKYPDVFIMQVPEVTYTPSSSPVLFGNWSELARLHAEDVQPTGRTHWVQLAYGVEKRLKILPGPRADFVPAEALPSLPSAYSGLGTHDNPVGIGHLETRRSGWGPVASVAAAPLYPLDCALGLASNTAIAVVGLGYMVVMPAVLTTQELAEQVEERQEAAGGEKVLLMVEPGVESLPEDEDIAELLLR